VSCLIYANHLPINGNHMNRDQLFIDNFKFTAVQEVIDENGLWNPVDNSGPFMGGLQINIYGDKDRFLKLSNYFKLMAEAVDDHDHCEVLSEDQLTRLHFIFRAHPDGR
jgi:hypothetical protein